MWFHHVMAKSWEKGGIVTDFIFLGSKSLQTVTATTELKDVCFLEKKKP